MSDPVSRLNAALEGRYAIERELGEGGIATVYRRFIMCQEQRGWFWFLMPLAVGLLVPSLVLFYLEVFVGDIPPSEAVVDILGRQFGGGNNLFILALIGLIPFAALSVILRAMVSRQWSPARLSCLAVGGLVGILFFMVLGHYSVWYPYYGSGDPSSTGVIAFLFIPFLCLPTLGIGLLAGWGVSLLPVFGVTVNREE